MNSFLHNPMIVLSLVNILLLSVSYFFIYPFFIKRNLDKLAFYDFFVSTVALFIAMLIYVGSDEVFYIFSIETSWWVFSIVSYAFFEIPFFVAYKWRFGI